MTYELAKELKDARFWEQDFLIHRDWGRSDFVWLPSNEITKHDREKLWIPTLEELMEACGGNEGFVLDEQYTDVEGWWNAKNNHESAQGSTPAEAVANLWLALNKK